MPAEEQTFFAQIISIVCIIFYKIVDFDCSLPPLRRQNYDPELHQALYESLPFSYERSGRMEADQMQLYQPVDEVGLG
jgi:hypothetical protein